MPRTESRKILAFDTSSSHGSIALLSGSEIQAELKLRRLQNHSANLIRSIHFLLGSLNWNLGDLDLIATGIGPGSFTGIRIGIATGIGMAQSLSLPFVGISGLEALGFQSSSVEGSIVVLLNAHREQIYYAEYQNDKGRMKVSRKPSLIFISELPLLLKKRKVYLTGDTELYPVEEFKKTINAWPRVLKTEPFLAAAIGHRALTVKRRWKSGQFIQWEPLYIRPPDAIKNKSGR